MKPVYVLSEYEKNPLLLDYELSADERDYLTSISMIHPQRPWEKRFYVDELRNGLRLQTLNWVGVIELERARIVIQPKFDEGFASLIEMIAFVEDLPFHQWKDTRGVNGKTDFLELLVRFYIRQLESLWNQGLVKEYVEEEENLQQLRGRPDFVQNLRANYHLPPRIFCRYDELVMDIPENQVILLALESAMKFPLQRKTLQKINQFRSQFEMICQPYPGKDWPMFTYHRLNAHYENVHRLTRYILGRTALTSYHKGEGCQYYAFLLDMNELFESFVAALLRKFLPRQSYRLRHGSRITDAIQKDGDSYRHVIPDLLVDDLPEKKVKVLDVKYKHYAGKKVETSDIFQLAFYAQYHQKVEGVHSSAIIFPRYKEDPSLIDEKIELLPGTYYGGKLRLQSISIEEILQWVRERKKEELQHIAMKLIK